MKQPGRGVSAWLPSLPPLMPPSDEDDYQHEMGKYWWIKILWRKDGIWYLFGKPLTKGKINGGKCRTP